MDEIWKPVASRPGVSASSLGRILFPCKEAAMPHGGVRRYVTKPVYGTTQRSKKGAKHEYKGVYNRSYGNMKVHRLVCEAFHGPAPDQRSVVIHIDENALNNRPENLRWGTQKENLNMPKFLAWCRSDERAALIKEGKRKARDASA